MSSPEIDQDNPFGPVPEPSDYDVANLRNILSGDGDWFDAYLFRLILKADGTNIERLRMVYPFHVKAFEVHVGRRES